MIFDPRYRIPPGHTVFFCTSCDARLTAPLVAEENELSSRLRRRAEAAKRLKGGHEQYQERQALWREVSMLKESRSHIRNRHCRACREPLKGCTDPYYQKGSAFGHMDLHAPGGFGRAWFLFHTECLRRWLLVNVQLPEAVKKRMSDDWMPRGQQMLVPQA